ncbi:MAG: Preprotein translocase, SecE subunit [Parcubacteria group bacterium GW2011_GWA2_51_10]|nr:MAG: Preprotein translocase, SecE subunit [Parcubacteria group bacterium GW2011_GWA2_51_10]
MGLIQYVKDTRGELRHVAWPTRFQTIVYTILVIVLSLLVAAYLGLFDYLFTSGLRNALEVLPEGSAPPPALSTSPIEIVPSIPFDISGGANGVAPAPAGDSE